MRELIIEDRLARRPELQGETNAQYGIEQAEETDTAEWQ